MTWAQRIVLIVYCRLWVPWHSVPPDDIQVRTGYGVALDWTTHKK
jgi:hypothetical protein